MTILLSSLAYAGTYSVELAVPSVHSPMVADNIPTGASRVLGPAEGEQDVVVASTHPAVTCEIKNEALFVRMAADAASYPTSFPFNAQCSYSGETLDVTVVTIDPASDRSLQSIQLDSSNSVSIVKIKNSRDIRAYILPDCNEDYTLGKPVQATGVPGVFCEAKMTYGEPHVYVDIHAVNNVGTAVCPMQMEDGSTQDITFHISEAGI